MKSRFIIFTLLLSVIGLLGCTAVTVDTSLPLEHPANRLALQSPWPEVSRILDAEPVEVSTLESTHEHHH
ncbi:MAG TPA: hypothetical protein DEO86_06355 [Colwellia sp.]|nr:hypothetical protein [Colwellia sp.]|tara:strand:- start:14787 stop:14996 length:210 start_codon:yes stop_codon:yes gene_type:complete